MEYSLRSCVWEITLKCCFNCAYCGSRAGKARENELNTAECLSVADQLAALGCERVSLIGGEVFMRGDWAKIVERLTKNGISTAIITNGFLLDESIITELKRLGVESVAVSIDGIEPVHDRFRQSGSFARATGALEALKDSGIPASVITTLNAESAPHLEELYDILKDKGIAAWQIQACSPMGNAHAGGVDHRFDFRAVMDFIRRHSDAPFSLGIADNIGYFTEDEGFLRGVSDGKTVFCGCGAGLSAIGIDSVGNVRGCESMYDETFIEGNLRAKTLAEIWSDPDAFSYNRRFKTTLLTGACRECEAGKYCAGGCRSYNFFVHGRLYESPYCARNRAK